MTKRERRELSAELRQAVTKAKKATETYIAEQTAKGLWTAGDRAECFELGYLRASVAGIVDRLDPPLESPPPRSTPGKVGHTFEQIAGGVRCTTCGASVETEDGCVS
jgi:hypothetical protein